MGQAKFIGAWTREKYGPAWDFGGHRAHNTIEAFSLLDDRLGGMRWLESDQRLNLSKNRRMLLEDNGKNRDEQTVAVASRLGESSSPAFRLPPVQRYRGTSMENVLLLRMLFSRIFMISGFSRCSARLLWHPCARSSLLSVFSLKFWDIATGNWQSDLALSLLSHWDCFLLLLITLPDVGHGLDLFMIDIIRSTNLEMVEN